MGPDSERIVSNWIPCLDLVPFLDGTLKEREANRFRNHLGVCVPCQDRLHDQMQAIMQIAPIPTNFPEGSLPQIAAAYLESLDRYRDRVAGSWPAEAIGRAGQELNSAEVALRQALMRPIASVERMIADLGADSDPPSGWETKVWSGARRPPGRLRRMWNWLLDKE